MSATTNSRQGTTSSGLLRAMGSDSAEDIRLDFDTRRDIRLRTLDRGGKQSDLAQDAEEGRLHDKPPSVQPVPSHQTSTDGSDWLKDRFLRRGKRNIGVLDSVRAIIMSSWLNVLYIFIPISWALHFTNNKDPEGHWPFEVKLPISLIAMIPLERSLEYGGNQISLYCGKEMGDLIIVTLNNTVEATLAIILLFQCQLRILQLTIIGVIILHLLLVPGVSFIVGGANVIYQSLDQHSAQLTVQLRPYDFVTRNGDPRA